MGRCQGSAEGSGGGPFLDFGGGLHVGEDLGGPAVVGGEELKDAEGHDLHGGELGPDEVGEVAPFVGAEFGGVLELFEGVEGDEEDVVEVRFGWAGGDFVGTEGDAGGEGEFTL